MVARWLIFHVASGQAFFSGAGAILVAVLLSHAGRGRHARVAGGLLAAAGMLLVVASATPLPVAWGLALRLAWASWLAREWWARARGGRRPSRCRLAVAALWTAAILAEAPALVAPRVPPLGRPVLGIVGDSVTAGTGDSAVVTWPALLSGRRGVPVRDHSAAGATVASALRQARELSPEERLVLLEIGGNDLLGGTAPRDFEAGLRALLSAARRPGRVDVMLELPLVPGFEAFGRIQRRLVREFGVLLAPRRVLLGVLLAEGATVDSVHLSQDGQRRMAEAMWRVVAGAYRVPRQ